MQPFTAGSEPVYTIHVTRCSGYRGQGAVTPLPFNLTGVNPLLSRQLQGVAG